MSAIYQLKRRRIMRKIPMGQARKDKRDDGIFYASALVAVLLWGAVGAAQTYEALFPKTEAQTAAIVPVCDDEPMRVARKVCRE